MGEPGGKPDEPETGKEVGKAETTHFKKRKDRMRNRSCHVLRTLSLSLLVANEAQFALAQAGSWNDVAKVARQAVQLDAHLCDAALRFADYQANLGNITGAKTAVQKVLAIETNSALAWRLLGSLLIFQGNYEEARHDLEISAQLFPQDPLILERLGEAYALLNRNDAAKRSFEAAFALNPGSADILSHLARFSLFSGQPDYALTALARAERYDAEDDVRVEETLWSDYGELHESVLAAKHCKRFIELLEGRGISPERLQWASQSLAHYTERLTPCYITNIPPRLYEGHQLNDALARKLSPTERAFVVNPLEATDAMAKWARSLIVENESDFDKAKTLFDALKHHLDRRGLYQSRTAAEVFQKWSDAAVAFHCQDYTYLYVALARTCGLAAYVVSVKEACDGQISPHTCAAVFCGGRGLLVDISYFWFGAPHKQFIILDDMTVIAEYSASFMNQKLCRTAYKIDSSSPQVVCNLAITLANDGLWIDARRLIPALDRVDSTHAITRFLQAKLAAHDDDGARAIELLHEAIQLDPNFGIAYLSLGQIDLKEGKIPDAKRAFLMSLQCMLSAEDASAARYAVAQIDEKK